MFGSFGWMELLLILIIVLIIFGAGKIPQLGEGLGKAIKGFKKSVHEADAIDVTATEAEPAPAQPAAQIQQTGQPATPPPAQQAGAAPPPRTTAGTMITPCALSPSGSMATAKGRSSFGLAWITMRWASPRLRSSKCG